MKSIQSSQLKALLELKFALRHFKFIALLLIGLFWPHVNVRAFVCEISNRLIQMIKANRKTKSAFSNPNIRIAVSTRRTMQTSANLKAIKQ